MSPSTRDALYCFERAEKLRLALERAELSLRQAIKYVPETEFGDYIGQSEVIARTYDDKIGKLRSPRGR